MFIPKPTLVQACVQQAAYIGVRTASSGLLAFGVEPTMRAAKSMGNWYANRSWNRKRLQRAVDHIGVAFPDWDEPRRRRMAVTSYEHLFMLGVETAYTPRLMTQDAWMDRVQPGDLSMAVDLLLSGRPGILLTGHVGNWELLGHMMALLSFPMHAVYRPLDSRPLDRWLRRTRQQRGLRLVDKFGVVQQLPGIVQAGAPVGFVADQNGGDRGVFVPFFGRLTSTYKAIGLLAIQFDAPIICGLAKRTEPENYRFAMEVIDIIRPEDWKAQPDPLFYLTARYRRAIERMIRMAPEQYLWMHRIWRSRPRHERVGKPFPGHLEDKLRALPWMTDEDLEGLKDFSERDARTLKTLGVTKLP